MARIDCDDGYTVPVLTRRYRLQICFPEADQREEWDTIESYHTPRESLRGCSSALETVKEMLEVPFGYDLEDDVVRFRVWDSDEETALLWEDANGSVYTNGPVFDREEECEAQVA